MEAARKPVSWVAARIGLTVRAVQAKAARGDIPSPSIPL